MCVGGGIEWGRGVLCVLMSVYVWVHVLAYKCECVYASMRIPCVCMLLNKRV